MSSSAGDVNVFGSISVATSHTALRGEGQDLLQDQLRDLLLADYPPSNSPV